MTPSRGINAPYIRYTPEIGREICERLAGGELLREICSEPDRMPDRRSVSLWLLRDDHEEFQKLYYAARQIQAEMNAEDIVAIADGKAPVEKSEEKDTDRIRRDDLRVRSRQWNAENLLGRYSKRHVISGDKEAPLEVTYNDLDRVKAIAAAVASAKQRLEPK